MTRCKADAWITESRMAQPVFCNENGRLTRLRFPNDSEQQLRGERMHIVRTHQPEKLNSFVTMASLCLESFCRLCDAIVFLVFLLPSTSVFLFLLFYLIIKQTTGR